MMIRAALIGLHSAAGVIAFVAGWLAVTRGPMFKVPRRGTFSVYACSLVALLVFMAAAVGVDWAVLGIALRVVFVALMALAGYMLVRAWQAWRVLPRPGAERSAHYCDHVGFTLIALFDGFAIIVVLTANGPGWLAAVAGVAGVVVGSLALRRLKAGLPAAKHLAD